MNRPDSEALQSALLDVFYGFGLDVAVGLTSKGVSIRSQDEQVDAANLGPVEAYDERPQ